MSRPKSPNTPKGKPPKGKSTATGAPHKQGGNTRSKAWSEIPVARLAALAALEQTLVGRDAQAALDHFLTKPFRLEPRDAGLATELVYGYLRLGLRIQYILSRFLRNPEGLPQAARLVLGVAAYEILFLSIPHYASVNWAVERLKQLDLGKLSGVANAVLRKVAGLGNEVHEKAWYAGPGEDPEGLAVLARYWSCPEWIVALWRVSYGPMDAERYLRAQLLPPALGLAASLDSSVEPGRAARAADQDDTDQAGLDSAVQALDAHPARMDRLGLGFAYPAGSDLEALIQETGAVRVSFAGRQALYALGAETWQGPVWDGCAGRGGKARVLAELGLEVLATDVHKGRIDALQRELSAPMGRYKVLAGVHSVLDGPPITPHGKKPFPTVLLDVPCSGLGVLSRRPDIKWKRGMEHIAELEALQQSLLKAAWPAVAKGGRLVYLTCTLNRSENQDQVARFLAEHADAALERDYTTPASSNLGEFFYGAVFLKN